MYCLHIPGCVAVPPVELRGNPKHSGEGGIRVDALRDIALAVHPGQVFGLPRPGGSGKRTLHNVIDCIVAPGSGWMRLDGEVVYEMHWLRPDLRRLRLETYRVHLPVPQFAAVPQQS